MLRCAVLRCCVACVIVWCHRVVLCCGCVVIVWCCVVCCGVVVVCVVLHYVVLRCVVRVVLPRNSGWTQFDVSAYDDVSEYGAQWGGEERDIHPHPFPIE